MCWATLNDQLYWRPFTEADTLHVAPGGMGVDNYHGAESRKSDAVELLCLAFGIDVVGRIDPADRD
jgi:hypothetical protein